MSDLEPKIKAEILAEALPYIQKFHGKTIVIKYGKPKTRAIQIPKYTRKGRKFLAKAKKL